MSQISLEPSSNSYVIHPEMEEAEVAVWQSRGNTTGRSTRRYFSKQSRRSEGVNMTGAAERPTQFIITVDTETYAINNAPPAFQTNIYADLPDGSFGVQRIMDICNRHNVKATFFVDVYMHHHDGRNPVRDLC